MKSDLLPKWRRQSENGEWRCGRRLGEPSKWDIWQVLFVIGHNYIDSC